MQGLLLIGPGGFQLLPYLNMENLPSSPFHTSRMCELCVVFCHVTQNNAMLRGFPSCIPQVLKRVRSFGFGPHWQKSPGFLQILQQNISRFSNT